MGSDQNNNSGCFPFGDDFLPILMFFFHLNQAESSAPQYMDDDDDDDGDEEEGEDEEDNDEDMD